MIGFLSVAGGSNVSIPLNVLIAVLSFGLSGTTGFVVWIIKQITMQSRYQAETAIVLKGILERNAEDRQKMERLDDMVRGRHDRTSQGERR